MDPYITSNGRSLVYLHKESHGAGRVAELIFEMKSRGAGLAAVEAEGHAIALRGLIVDVAASVGALAAVAAASIDGAEASACASATVGLSAHNRPSAGGAWGGRERSVDSVKPAAACLGQADDPVALIAPAGGDGGLGNVQDGVRILPRHEDVEADDVTRTNAQKAVCGGGPELSEAVITSDLSKYTHDTPALD